MRTAELETSLVPYRERSNREIASLVDAYTTSRGPTTYPSLRTLTVNEALFGAGKRYRYAIACLTFQALTGRPDFEVPARPATWLELYHLYTLYLDDIMDEDERRRTVRSAWSANARLYRRNDASRPARAFRTVRNRYGVSMAILDALRIRSLAERAIQGSLHVPIPLRGRLLELLTETDLRLSDGQGLDIDFEGLRKIPEADYERMSHMKTGVLYVAAARTGAILANEGSGRSQRIEEYAERFAVAFQDRDDLLGAGVVPSRIGGSRQGDIAQGKRTRLFAMATARMPAPKRKAFVAAYGKGVRTTAKDVRLVRSLLREYALPDVLLRIEKNVARAIEVLEIAEPAEPYGGTLAALAAAQLTRQN